MLSSTQKAIELACLHTEDGLYFYGSEGVARAQITGARATIDTMQGENPLGAMPAELDLATPHLAGKYPDLIHQFSRSYVDGRSSPLLLLAATDTHFGQGPRFGYRMGFHKGTHGGPSAAEVLVTGVFRGPLPEATNPNSGIRSADLLHRLELVAPKT